jgi:hypothetical protein
VGAVRASDRKDSTPRDCLKTVALRDFSLAYACFGSFSAVSPHIRATFRGRIGLKADVIATCHRLTPLFSAPAHQESAEVGGR